MSSNGNSTALATRQPAQVAGGPTSLSRIEQVLIGGDLKDLSPEDRLTYYEGLCESFNLNPLSQPFQYLELQGKLTLYATKACAAQLRDQKKVSIYKLEESEVENLYVVRAYARTPDGREDVDEGSVPLLKEDGEWKTSSNNKRYFQGNGTFLRLKGEDMVNARLKAVTKAKRRVTLSICGLGFLDETEVDSVGSARRVHVNVETGEILDETVPQLAPVSVMVGPDGIALIEQLAPQAGMTVAEINGKMGVLALSELSDEAARKVVVRLRRIIAEQPAEARTEALPTAPSAPSPEVVAAVAEDRETEKLKADVEGQFVRLGLRETDAGMELMGELIGYILPEWEAEGDTNNLQRKRLIAQLRKFKGQEDAQEWVGFKRDEARKAEEEKAAAQAKQAAEDQGEPTVKIFGEAEMQWATGDFGGESERKAKPADRIFDEPADDIPF